MIAGVTASVNMTAGASECFRKWGLDGLDGIPAWFLRLGAPIFAAPLALLFNQTIMEGTVPQQWKTAAITPIPKVPRPSKPSKFRPISVTPVLSRSLEKYVVRHHIYPALRDPPPQLNFEDQYAFRPTGSTTAAIIAILHTVRSMLSTNEYVHVFAFDFSKAFDTVRHSTLMSKLATTQRYRQYLQLGARLFHRQTYLHAICWPVVDCRRYQSQRDTGLRTRTGVLRCHSC